MVKRMRRVPRRRSEAAQARAKEYSVPLWRSPKMYIGSDAIGPSTGENDVAVK
jgi:hypothetical protein